MTAPGLHLKKPFVYVDCFARWRITDPLLFFQRLRDEAGAQSRLDDILDGETRNTVARHDLIEVVRSINRPFAATEELAGGGPEQAAETIQFGRRALDKEVLTAAAARTADLGIEILGFRFKRISYVEAVQKEVFSRMISERKRIAAPRRSAAAPTARPTTATPSSTASSRRWRPSRDLGRERDYWTPADATGHVCRFGPSAPALFVPGPLSTPR